ncbi:MAG: sensor histidine kinase [Acidimicrobiia bacterium]
MTIPAETMTAEAPRRSRLRLRVGGARLRILGWYVVLLVAATVGSVLLLREVLIHQLDDEVEVSLTQETEELRALSGGRNPETGQPFGEDVAAVFDTFLDRNLPHEGEALFTFVEGRPYRASFGAPYRLDAERDLVRRWTSLRSVERGEVDTPAGPARYLAVPLRFGDTTRGVFVVANFVAGERSEVDHAIRVAAVVAVSVLLVASLIAWLVAGRVLAPVRALTDATRSITETDLTRRLPVRGGDEIAELTATFNSMVERLEAAFATQRAFVDDAGHELRTPITIIRGHLELMGDDPEDRRQTLELVTDELDRMSRMVDDLALLAKAERPGFLEPEPVDVAAFTRALHDKVTSLAGRDWRLEQTAAVTVMADRQRLTQALTNLAQNATQHTDAGDIIGIGSAVSRDELRIWVRDTGSGIDPADQQRIFERFTRATNGRRRSDGAGLGLAIVRAIADAHGGRVELYSRVGAGATFTLVVPRHTEARPEQWRAS